MIVQNIPTELQKYPNWVVWRYEERDGKKTKVPYNATNRKHAKANDSSTWNTFQQVENLPKWADGIGFMFSESPFVGIDIDHCFDGGEQEQKALALVKHFGTYAEKSPSGDGLHMIGRAGRIKGRRFGSVEIYSEKRYFTMTGEKLETAGAICDIQDKLNEFIYEQELGRKVSPVKQAPADSQNGNELSADEIIERIRWSKKQGAMFTALYDRGDIFAYGGDDSAADMALMDILPFWTWGDPEKMMEIFNGSKLAQREKWQNRPDYRQATLEKALKDWNGEKYDPKAYAEQQRQQEMEQDDDIIKAPKWPKGELVKVGGKEVFRPIKAAWENTKYLIDSLGIRCRYNRMRKEVDFSGQGLEKLSFDAAVTYIRGLAHQNGLKISRTDLQDNIGIIAEQDSYSPACDYLTDCHIFYDGQDHLSKLWDCFVLAEGQNKEFCYTLFKKWLISCVKLAFNEGDFAAQGILILKGPQGIGKTRFLYRLLPQADWGADGIALDPNVKDDVLKIMGCWLVELGEFGETLRKERLDSLKQFITQPADKLRRPYGRATERLPRTTAFLGTVNDDRFLKDSTGERRYWVISLKNIREDDSIDMEQVWGQVMEMAFTDNIPAYLTADELAILNGQNMQYKRLTDEELVILDKLDWDTPEDSWRWIAPAQLADELRIPGKRTTMVGRALRNIASRDPRVKIPTNNMDRRYRLPPERHDFQIEEG